MNLLTVQYPSSKESKKSKKRETPTQEEEHQDSDASELSSQAQVDTFRRRDLNSYDFPDAHEKKLVAFFTANECFYNKLSEKYDNKQYKDRLLAEMAFELECEGLFHSLFML